MPLGPGWAAGPGARRPPGAPHALVLPRSERRLEPQEPLVVDEPHVVGPGVEHDALDAAHAHVPEPGREPEVAARLVARPLAAVRSRPRPHDRDAVVEPAEAER